MKICGIIAEYNPFHLGHARQIALVRERLGAETVAVCAMSGDFVQRGGPALFAKHARAEAAVRGGADLVLELPLPWAMCSAEGFARGGTALLAAAGAEYLCFGSECGDLELLEHTAALLAAPELDVLLKSALCEGASYAEARQRAAEALAGGPVPLLRAPNDILALEYLKAIRTLGLPLAPIAIRREGAGHDAPAEAGGPYLSAAALRERLAGGGSLAGAVPEAAEAVFLREMETGRGPVFPESLESALLSRLRFLPPEAFGALPDATGGLERRLARVCRGEYSADRILEAAGTKRYPRARLRRMLWAAALGLRREDAEGTPPYLRVLAANARGRRVLASRRGGALPVLTKPSVSLAGRAARTFALGAEAADFYALGFPTPERRWGGLEYTTSPVMIFDE